MPSWNCSDGAAPYPSGHAERCSWWWRRCNRTWRTSCLRCKCRTRSREGPLTAERPEQKQRGHRVDTSSNHTLQVCACAGPTHSIPLWPWVTVPANTFAPFVSHCVIPLCHPTEVLGALGVSGPWGPWRQGWRQGRRPCESKIELIPLSQCKWRTNQPGSSVHRLRHKSRGSAIIFILHSRPRRVPRPRLSSASTGCPTLPCSPRARTRCGRTRR